MTRHTNVPVGEIIAPACVPTQVTINNYIDFSGLTVAGLLLVGLFGICLVLLIRSIIGRDRKRRK